MDDLVNVLYDSKQRKYLGKELTKEGGPTKVRNIKDARIFSDKEVSFAWETVYLCAWLEVGIFFVHGVERPGA